jgi:Transposase
LEDLADPEQITVVSMDLARAYRAAVAGVLPDAAIVVGNFTLSSV